jgi:hypothetical protein
VVQDHLIVVRVFNGNEYFVIHDFGEASAGRGMFSAQFHAIQPRTV